MYVGIDAGASATKAIIINERGMHISHAIVPSGINFKFSSQKALRKALKDAHLNSGNILHSVATGYGRALIDAESTSSEITCISRGVHKLLPSARTIIDVGGQDSKAIRINEGGRVLNFIMNDKCAAGTGKFLEVMASTLRMPIEELGKLHLKASNPVKISSTCTVFAESEVISHISQGIKIEDVIAGLQDAIAERIYNMCSRIGFAKDFAFTGGVAKSQGFVEALSKKVGAIPLIPEEPQIICALGAALAAIKKHKEK
ncbi:MAG: 2-hydroxyglutaryl-CoA dehydratase [Candidatus Bathyarchaeota archaeon]|nr:MAG: 2-hydroxyglutaryl-CoA dehydratase [Candidatus Bathyarchaeota archaeon]